MMRKAYVLGLLAAGLLSGADAAAAQTGMLPVAVGVRGGAALPVGEFPLLGEDAAETGWGFEVNAQFRVAPVFAIYGAYDWFQFPIDQGVVGGDETDVTDSGFALGGMFWLPTGFIGVTPWVRAGAIYNTLDYGDDFSLLGGEFESDRSLGYEVGAGATFPLGLVVSFTPAIRYRSYSPEFGDAAIIGEDSDLSYVVADLGLTFRF